MDCINHLRKGEEYQVFCDDGKSAKDIEHRPEFMRMMEAAKEGLIERIIVKKYDRFSRNMREYLNVTNTLDGYGVSVVSLSEPFNTETKEGRMMRNNLLNFAEFERETIAARVKDAYDTRAAETGFYQGGKIFYGYQPERRTVNGKTGSVLVPSVDAEVVRITFNMYRNPKTSLGDILKYFRSVTADTGVKLNVNKDRAAFSQFMRSPLYVRADKEVYRYLMSKGFDIVDDIEAFDGVHGLFRHKRQDGSEYLKLGYHEGLVDAETWLSVQDKKAHNKRIPNNATAKSSWLTGLTKCGICGYALTVKCQQSKLYDTLYRYYNDLGALRTVGCTKKRLKIRPDVVEEKVYEAMKERLESFTIAKSRKEKPDAEAEGIKTELIRIDGEIKTLIGQLAKANDVLFAYIQESVNNLHAKKSELEEKLRNRARKQKEIDTSPLVDPMSRWESLTFDEKHSLALAMIEVVKVSDEHGIDIEFSI
jgi:DNA invertase Pin-like site-specific DNA recombinase